MSHRKVPPVQNDAPGMRGQRGRNPSGPLREKRGDTLLKNIPELDHKDLPISRHAKLQTLREQMDTDSLKAIIRKLPAKK